jgi:hypothetical protein
MNALTVCLLFIALAFVGLLLGVLNQAVFVQKIAYRFNPYARYPQWTPSTEQSYCGLLARVIAALCFCGGMIGAIVTGALWLVSFLSV